MNNCDYRSAYPYRTNAYYGKERPRTMKIDFQWPHAVVFSVVFAGLVYLVAKGHVHPEILSGMLLWLAPTPLTTMPIKKAE